MKARPLILLGLCLVLLLGSGLFVEQPAAGAERRSVGEPFAALAAESWPAECIECPRHFDRMSDRSLRLDGQGRPHLAYGENHLYYAWHDGTIWRYETADIAPQVGLHAALALDDQDNPHISYYDEINHNLKYAYRFGGQWLVQTVDGQGYVGRYTSIAVDAQGRAHISYLDESNNDLKYAAWTGSKWDIQTVDKAGTVGWYASLALDADGNPHISYFKSFSTYDSAVLYARRVGGVWDIQTVDNEDVVGKFTTSIAVDAAGAAHISYSDWTNNDLKYAHWTGDDWDIWRVDSEGAVGYDTSIALDAAGRPSISYLDVDNQDLKLARWTGDEWALQTVDDQDDVGGYTSLAVDGSGHPAISYYDSSNEDLKLARWTGDEWERQIADSQGGVISSAPSLALDVTGRPHVGYVHSDYPDSALKYARRLGGAWQVETVEGISAAGPSLALDGAGDPHISYLDESSKVLKYAARKVNAWEIQPVAAVGVVSSDDRTSLALDAAGWPVIAYVDWATRDLKLARWISDTWDIQTVDNNGTTPAVRPSLALDGAGNPFIAYFSPSALAVKLAWWTGSEWEIVPVEGAESEGVSLALDGAGNPHVAYYNYINQDFMNLRYARQTDSVWSYHTADQWVGCRSCAPSLALDAGGDPHISYYDGDSALKIADWTEGGFDTQVAADQGWVGAGSSLALDPAGMPHVAYQYARLGDLMYTRNARYDPLLFPLQLSIKAMPAGDLNSGDTLTYTLSLYGPAASMQLWDPLPDNVDFVPGSIGGTLSPPAVYRSGARAVTWQGMLPVGAMQTVHFQVKAVVPQSGNQSVTAPIINTAWLTDTEYGRSISATHVTGWRIHLPLLLRAQPSPDTRLVFHLDEPAGATTFLDASVYQHNGGCSGVSCPTAGVPGRIKSALYFDGLDDSIALGNPAALNFSGLISLEAWVKIEATGGIRNIISHGYSTSPQAEVFLRLQDGQVQVGSWDGQSHRVGYPIPAGDIGQWVHLAGVYDGTTWRLYRNGVLVSVKTDSLGAIPVSGDWAIGSRGTGTERFFQCSIDEAAIYHRALTPQEILSRLSLAQGDGVLDQPMERHRNKKTGV